MAIEVKNDVYLTITEASKEIGRAKQTVYQNWKEWGWDPHKYGNSILFKKSDLKNWLESNIVQV